MAEKAGAYGTKASDTDFRKKWDKEEYAERARKKDEEERTRMQENEARMKQGTQRLRLAFHLRYYVLQSCRQETPKGPERGPPEANRAHETSGGISRTGQESRQNYGGAESRRTRAGAAWFLL